MSGAATSLKVIMFAIALALAAAGCSAETTTIEAVGDGIAQSEAPGQTDAPEEHSAAIEPFDEDNVPTTTTAPPLPAGDQASPMATIPDPNSPVTTFAVEEPDSNGPTDDPFYTGDPNSDYCQLAREFGDGLEEDPETIDEASAWLGLVAQRHQALRLVAPKEIESELATYSGAFQDMLQMAQEASSLNEFLDAIVGIESDELGDATDAVYYYNVQVCNVEW